MSESKAADASTLVPFPSTHWTKVSDACQDGAARGRALAALLVRYTPALRSFLVANFRCRPDVADDLLQGFLTDKVLGRYIIRRADRARGKFRTFLATALDRYVRNQLRKARAAKRTPPSQLGTIDFADVAEPVAPATPDVFDVEWSRNVLRLTLDRMERECRVKEREEIWAVFEGRVVGPILRNDEPVPLATLVERFGITPVRASNLLGTGKRMFERNLRALVSEYAAAGEDADEEIRQLRVILSRLGAGSGRIAGI